MASNYRYTPTLFTEPEGFSASERRGRSLEDPNTPFSAAYNLIFGSSSSFAGETVNEETALGVPAIWAAIQVIAGTIASLPLHLYRDDGDTRTKANSDPLYRVLHDVVNADYETSYIWRKKMVSRLLLGGRAYSFIERNGAGRTTGLWYLDPSRTSVRIVEGRKVYHYRRADGVEFTYQPGEIIDLVLQPASDGVTHLSPVHQLRNSIGEFIAASRSSSNLFQNGGVPPLQLHGAGLSPAAAKRAATDIQDGLQEARSDGRNVLYTGELKLEAIGLDPSKQQMLELRRFLVTEVARIWNIPPAFLHDLTSGTFNNVEQQDLAFAKHTLHPLLELIESELNAKLFSDRNRANCVEFSLDGLLRGDTATRTNAYRTGIFRRFPDAERGSCLREHAAHGRRRRTLHARRHRAARGRGWARLEVSLGDRHSTSRQHGSG